MSVSFLDRAGEMVPRLTFPVHGSPTHGVVNSSWLLSTQCPSKAPFDTRGWRCRCAPSSVAQPPKGPPSSDFEHMRSLGKQRLELERTHVVRNAQNHRRRLREHATAKVIRVIHGMSESKGSPSQAELQLSQEKPVICRTMPYPICH